MFLPLHDQNPIRHVAFPYVTYGLIGLNVVVFLLQLAMGVDSFECAIHRLAPVCPHCSNRIVGHGVEARGEIFCCVHCASEEGVTQLRDRV
jgi:membrane associated rhomboid family serine protease